MCTSSLAPSRQFACEVRHERIPLRVGQGVGEDGPDGGGRRVDVDLAAKFAHVPAWSLGPKRHDEGGPKKPQKQPQKTLKERRAKKRESAAKKPDSI